MRCHFPDEVTKACDLCLASMLSLGGPRSCSLVCSPWWSQKSCCEMFYRETHVANNWGRLPANFSWSTEASVQCKELNLANNHMRVSLELNPAQLGPSDNFSLWETLKQRILLCNAQILGTKKLWDHKCVLFKTYILLLYYSWYLLKNYFPDI